MNFFYDDIVHVEVSAYTVTGQLADTPTRGLPTRRLDGHLADWTTRGLAMPPKELTKTKHAKSPVASASCPVTAYAH